MLKSILLLLELVLKSSRVLATLARRKMVITSFICHCLKCSPLRSKFHFTTPQDSFGPKEHSLFRKCTFYGGILCHSLEMYNHGRNSGPFLLGDSCLMHRYILFAEYLGAHLFTGKRCFLFPRKDQNVFTHSAVSSKDVTVGMYISDHKFRRDQKKVTFFFYKLTQFQS